MSGWITAVGVAVLSGVTADAKPASGIALEVLEPPERQDTIVDFPVTLGLVFPAGRLATVPGGGVVDDLGRAVPFEAEPTGWWDPNKTHVKWLLVRLNASTDRKYFFRPGAEAAVPGGEPIAVESHNAIDVSTGPLQIRIDRTRPGLFLEARLNGRPVLRPLPECFILVASDGGVPIPSVLSDWNAGLEESTPLGASVKATGCHKTLNGKPLARLGLRYQFFKGESFVRIFHTLTWMVRDPKIGLRDLSLRLVPAVGESGQVRVGESDYADTHTCLPWEPASRVVAFQDGPAHFRVRFDNRQVKEGERLGGWIALEGSDGRGVGASLRHAWQTYPTALGVEEGQLRVKFWPEEAPPAGFEPRDIMPDDFYCSAYWNRFDWVEGKGHFVHEYSKHPHFEHTAEGAARTHELTLFFYDDSSRRTTSQLNSITQHPMVLRQDPKSAMRVPFMGLEIVPVDWENYPGMERAIDGIGRMAVGRWASAHDFGLWRFGMMRWGGTGVSYRWMDGHQYDLPLIPWLLYLRGGGRRWFEEGQATTRFAMDVATTHATTREYPAGNQAAAAAMPFPWGPKFLTKAPKVHFLSCCYHLTGDKRAKEVMQEVIAGNKAAAEALSGPVHARGRELYNMNVFWVNAYNQTWDPQLRTFARQWLDLTLDREYNPKLNVFRSPIIYLYRGLILQHELWNDDRLKQTMLRNLQGLGYPDFQDGGVYRAEDAVACGWAYRQTGDERYVQAAWDIARTLADLVPDHDWDRRQVPSYPINGNQFYRHFLMPILVGYSLGARHGRKQADPMAIRDTFISLPRAGEGLARATLFLRPRQNGDLNVRILMIGVWENPVAPMNVTAFDPAGRELARAAVTAEPRAPVEDRYYPIGWRTPQRATLAIPAARPGNTYRLVIEGSDSNDPMALVLADADMVQEVDLGERIFFYNLAGQYYVGTRIFTRSTSDAITITNPFGRPFSVRDADTGELLHLFTMADEPSGTAILRVGKNRMLRITMTGRMDGRKFTGVQPYFSTTREGWHLPP
jgi:hypothetical protein